MQKLIHLPLAVALTLLASACGSSSSSPANFGAGYLPDHYAVFFAERTQAGRLEPYMVDLQTNAVRSLTAGLPPGALLHSNGKVLSPDGRILAVPFTVDSATHYAMIAVSDGEIRVLPYTTEAAGEVLAPIRFSFSPDSRRVLFEDEDSPSGMTRLYLMNVDATETVSVGEIPENLRVHGWAPDSSAFYVTAGHHLTSHRLLRIYDANTLEYVEMTYTGLEDIEQVYASADGSVFGLAL